MKKAWSLQARIGIGLAIGVTAMWIIATVAAGLAIRHELKETFDSALSETAQRLLYLAAIELADEDEDISAPKIAALGEEEEYLTYVVRDRDGKILLRSHDVDLGLLADKPLLGFRQAAGFRIYGEATSDRSLFIEIAEPLKERREAVMEAVYGLFSPLPVLIPLSLLWVWWFIRRSLRPMADLRAQIEVRGGGDMSPVAAAGLPTEIGPIAEAVNRLLGRLRRALEAERSFTSNSAHELRTPIAAALAQTQRLIAETHDEATVARARHVEATLHRLTRLSEKLMQLARAEGGGLLSETAQDLARVLPHVVDEFRTEADAAGRLRLSNPNGLALMSNMDPDAFGILLRNLIENALKHSPAGSPVDILIGAPNTVRVRNHGPAVPAATLARLKDRFERATGDNRGAGLGLAIAETIAAGAGADLELNSPATGQTDGFEAVLRLARTG